MRKLAMPFVFALPLFLILLSGTPQTAPQAAAQTSHDVSVVNITVPVRVFAGDRFVDTLRLEDFEVLEDGRPQRVQAVYLFRGNTVERQDVAIGTATPPTERHFVLLFQMTEWLPEVENAVDYFFDSVARSGDSVYIVTPRTTYRMKGKISSPEGLNKAKREVAAKVRQDTLVDSGAYNAVINDLLVNLGSDPDYPAVDLQGYALNLGRLERLRTVEPEQMAAFAAELKKLPGAKHVFLFFQRERVPKLSNRAMDQFLSSANSEQALKVMELMTQYSREVRIDSDAVRRAFADASIDVHFLYVTRVRRDLGIDVERPAPPQDVAMAEHSEDIYKAFREIAAATGGTTEASWNAEAMLKKAAAASENYYLLYYRPTDYKSDGKFHAITVKVRSGGYRISHREGYFATEGAGAAPPIDVTGPAAKPGTATTMPGGAASEPKTQPPKTVDVLEPLGPAPAETLLAAAAGYCRRLQDASLYFTCTEEVREQLSKALTAQAGVPVDMNPFGRGGINLKGGGKIHEWIYDYQLIRQAGQAEERRILLKEDGRAKREEDAKLATFRFDHSFVVLGPVGLLGEDAQKIHDYGIVKEFETDGEAVVLVDIRPKGETAASLYGKALVRRRDGAVLKIDWEPASMGNYEKIAQLAKESNARPKISFTSEYGFEKNGLRFPSSYGVTEDYVLQGTLRKLSKTDVSYKDYKFFLVRTEVRY